MEWKTFICQLRDYISNILASVRRSCNKRKTDKIPLFNTKQFFWELFFTSALMKWNNLNISVRHSESYKSF